MTVHCHIGHGRLKQQSPEELFREINEAGVEQAIICPVDEQIVPLGATEAQAKSGHGGADFKPVDAFIQAIFNDHQLPMDVYRSLEMTLPAIIAAESGRRGGILLDVPRAAEFDV